MRKMKVRNIGGMILAGGKNRRMNGQKKLFLEYEGRTFLDILKERLSCMEHIYLSVESEAPYHEHFRPNLSCQEKGFDNTTRQNYQEKGSSNGTDPGDQEKTLRNAAASNHYEGGTTDLQLIEDRYPDVGPIGGIASVLSVCKEDALFVVACDMPFLQEGTIEHICEVYEQHPGQITIPECGGKLHPLCGIYPRSSLPIFREQIQKGDYKMLNLLERFEVNLVTLPEDDPSFQNINTVSEYRELRGNNLNTESENRELKGNSLNTVSENRELRGNDMLQLEEAVKILTEAVSPIIEAEEISLMEAAGRVLAEDITAPMDQPPFARSPLDGYAVRGEDTSGAAKDHPVELEVIGKIYAGEVFAGTVGENQCVRLMTGAPIPDGADAVIRQEDTDYGEELVQIYQELSPYQNYCYAGEDYRKGELLAAKGTVLSGGSIGVVAGTGRDKAAVFREPEITVISTGDEVIAPGNVLKPGKIYDSNRYLVTGRLQDLGLKHFHSNHCEDEVEKMCRRIKEALTNSDLIITTGGVSVGEKDIMHQVQEQLHGEKLFWRVDLKPGAPTLAFVVDHTLIICLTGNPYGVAVNFELLVRPVIAKLTGNERWESKRQYAILENDSPKRGGVRRFMRGYYTRRTAGRLTENTPDYVANDSIGSEVSGADTAISAEISAVGMTGAGSMNEGTIGAGAVRILDGNHAAGTLATMVSCNCLVEIPEEGSGKKGETVWIYPL